MAQILADRYSTVSTVFISMSSMVCDCDNSCMPDFLLDNKMFRLDVF
jgi:hypothetical protein